MLIPQRFSASTESENSFESVLIAVDMGWHAVSANAEESTTETITVAQNALNATWVALNVGGPEELVIAFSDDAVESIAVTTEVTGVVGPQGPMGQAGPRGLVGEAGDLGSPGPPGPQGLTGRIGPQGLSGPVGPQGSAGAMGALGAIGPTGLQGLQGAKGGTGFDGALGLTGAQGPQGSTGTPGPTGPTGQKGDAGPVGARGAVGADADANLAASLASTIVLGTVFDFGEKQVTLATVAQNALVPTLSFVGSFLTPPTAIELGPLWKRNSVYKNPASGHSYVLTGEPLRWNIYLSDGEVGAVGLTGPPGIRGDDADAAVAAQMAASLLSGSIVKTLSGLADVSLAGASQGSLLTLDGTKWVPTQMTINQVYDGGNF